MRIKIDDHEEPEIGLIALIDCIFFLLMFFMVATSFKQKDDQAKQKQLPVNLPSARASLDAGDAAADPLIIGVNREGKLFLGNAPVSTVALHAELARVAKETPNRTVRIDGDRKAAYEHIVHVLDLCELNGLRQIAVHTR